MIVAAIIILTVGRHSEDVPAVPKPSRRKQVRKKTKSHRGDGGA